MRIQGQPISSTRLLKDPRLTPIEKAAYLQLAGDQKNAYKALQQQHAHACTSTTLVTAIQHLADKNLITLETESIAQTLITFTPRENLETTSTTTSKKEGGQSWNCYHKNHAQ